MTAILIAGVGLWLLAKVSKALVLLAIVSLFVFFPGKSASGAVCSDPDDHVLLTSTPGSLLR